MAGHSQFKNIMYRKGAQDARRAKVFTKIIRELTVAAKNGLPEPSANPRLRAAIQAAREANMPKDTVDRAIKRAVGGEDGAVYEEVRYEGYGPGGAAIIVEALTDNRNRTASEIRAAFSKAGGNLGETNSVAFMFERRGVVHYPATSNGDAVFEAALDCGAENVESSAEGHDVICQPEHFAALRDALEGKLGPAQSARLQWRALNNVLVDGAAAESLLRLVEALEDNDDVQIVFSNFDLTEETLARLTA